MWKTAVTFAIIVAASTPVWAQSDVTPGQRIRVKSSDRNDPVVGKLVSADSEMIWVVQPQADTVALPRKWVRGVDVSTGTYRSPRKGAAIGLLVGAGLGAIVGAAAYEPCEPHALFDCIAAPGSASQSAALGAIVFGALGGTVGLLIGTLSVSDRWTPASVRTSAQIRIVPRREGFGAQLSFAF